jgi:hypothetical protein
MFSSQTYLFMPKSCPMLSTSHNYTISIYLSLDERIWIKAMSSLLLEGFLGSASTSH